MDYSNVTEVVQTFPTYIETAARKFLSLGAASVIISEHLPTNVWDSGSYSRTPTIFSYYDLSVHIPLSRYVADLIVDSSQKDWEAHLVEHILYNMEATPRKHRNYSDLRS